MRFNSKARCLSSIVIALFCAASPALAATAPSLGAAQSFAVLGATTVTNTGPSVLTGDLGVSPGTAITGFPPGTATGTTYSAGATALQAQSDLTAAYNNIAGQTCNTALTGLDLGGMTLTPGVYCFSSSAGLTGTLTLNAQGNPNAVFIFQIVSTITTATSSSVVFINGGQSCNVFWQIGSSATLGTYTSFAGNILALTSITVTTGVNMTGRALARNGAVTLDTNGIDASSCAGPTAVNLRSFDAARQGADTVLSWRTGHETNNLGFRVYREGANGERVRVGNGMVAGNVLFSGPTIALSSGRSYSFTDRDAPAGGTYWLEDVDITGPSTMNGPVTARDSEISLFPVGGETDTMSAGGNSPLLDSGSVAGKGSHGTNETNETNAPAGFGSKPRGKVPSGSAATTSSTQNRQFSLAASPGMKVLVNQEGWYHVSHSDLVKAGWDPGASPANLQLFVEGQPIPMLVTDLGGGNYSMEFYGTGLHTVASDTRVYWVGLNTAPGTRIASTSASLSSSSGSSPGSDFPFTVERRDRVVYVPGILNGDAESWYGPIVGPSWFGSTDQSVVVTHLNGANSGPANLEVAIETATAGVAHSIDVTVNGNPAGTLSFVGQGHFDSNISVPVSWLVEGSNSILLQEEGDSAFSAMDYVALTYPHAFRADSDALEFTVSGSKHVSIPGFTVPGIRIFDITNPSAVAILSGIVGTDGSGGYGVTVNSPSAVGAIRILAVADDRVSTPESLANNAPSDLNKKNNSADLAMISHPSFLAALGPLQALRQSQGLATQIIDVADIYDEFSFGEKDPAAIKAFLQWTTSNWKKAPKYVLFVGDGSFDPRDYEGLGTTDFIPAKLVPTGYLKTASDDWFVDFNDDGSPDMAIGRLPAQTLADAATMVGKIVGYDSSAPSTGVLLVGDHNDQNSFHGAISELVSLVANGKTALPICLDPDPVDPSYPNIGTCVDAAAVHSGVLNAINGGVALVNWVGHGEQTSWSQQDVFNTGDVAELTNSSHLPIVLTMDCLNGYFHDPTAESMAESLLLAPSGGAVAVWASSSLALFESQVPVNQALFRQLFGTTSPRLGDAIKVAKGFTTDSDVKKTWILFGDPTMKMR